jgi:hypothetical protein
MHLALRLSGLLVLLAVAAWPRPRREHHDRAVAGVASKAHLPQTTSARRSGDRTLRPRAPKVEVLDLDRSDAHLLNN